MTRLFFILLNLLIVSHLSGQHFTVSISSDSILIGNYFKLEYTLENIEGSYEPPELDGLAVVSGPNTSSSVQVINGDKTSKTTYSYILKPAKEGSLTIPPAYLLQEDGTTIETAPMVLDVYPNPENLVIPIEENSNDLFNFRNFDLFGSPSAPAKPDKAKKRKYKKI